MTHLKIIQAADISNIETVSAQILLKLYEVASESTLDNTSDLRGHLHVPIGNRTVVEWIRAHFPNLTIDVDNYAIVFEDPNMLAYLQNTMGIGSTSGVITETEAAAATSVANSTNTSITKFNELKYFTNVTESRGGFNVNGSGDISFANWTALQEIDISNFTSIGHKNNWNMNDRFYGCAALKKVTASSRLTALGHAAFMNCENLEDIIGLSGTITLCDNAFYGCKKLKSSNFSNCSIFFDGLNNAWLFRECFALTTVPLSSSNTVIPEGCFYMCTALQSIVIPEGVATIKANAFRTCSSLSTITLPSSLTTIEHEAFQLCSNLAISPTDISRLMSIGYSAFLLTNTSGAIIFNSGLTSLGGGAFKYTKITSVDFSNTSLTKIDNEMFRGCTSLTSVTLSSSITELGEFTFADCHITSIDLSHITKTGHDVFTNSSLVNVVASNLTEIDGLMFSLCGSLISVDFTGSTFTKAIATVNMCLNLDHIIFPDTVTEVGQQCFYNCTKLRYIILPSPNSITFVSGKQIFVNVPSTCNMYVDDNKVAEVQNSVSQAVHGWGHFKGTVKPMSQFSTDFPNG